MTQRTIPSPSGPIDPDHQAALILADFSTWLAAAPGRRIVLTREMPGAFTVELEERRQSHGSTLQEATAQSAQVAALETGDAP